MFFGLKKVMPLMTEGLLQFPTLASQYFSLVSVERVGWVHVPLRRATRFLYQVLVRSFV